MKKIIFSLVFLTFYVGLISQNPIPYDADDPCTSEFSYPTEPWLGNPDVSGMPNLEIVQCGGCYYIVEWYYRQVAGVRIETQITKISKLGNSSSPCTPGCSFSEIRRMTYRKIWKLLRDNLEEYDLDLNSQTDEYTVQESQCHHILTVNETWEINDNVIVFPPTFSSPYVTQIGSVYNIGIELVQYPCASICCRMFYYVDWDSNDELISVEWTEIHGYGYLEQEECPNPPTTCANSCEELRWNWDINNGYSFNKEIFDFKENIINQTIKISPNPASDFLDIVIEDEFEGEFELIIEDLVGNVLLSQSYHKNTNLFKSNLNLNNISNGTYFVKYINKESIHIDKIIINK